MVYGGDGLPDSRAVAVFADIGGLHVQRTLTSRFGAVVAAEAVVRDIDVVKIGRRPGDGGVTVVAVVATRDMGWMFASRRYAVVTRSASAQDLRVVDDKYRRPHIAGVTVFANGACLNMQGALAGRVSTVVTAKAVAGDVYVIEIRG